jgi:uncharacterized protein YecE (DUF72 family)
VLMTFQDPLPKTKPFPAPAVNIRVGPAGWSYPDWRGNVYPRKLGRSFQPLPFLAKHFDIVEVNTSFYRIPDPLQTGDWAVQVQDFPRFRFAVKLFQGFTHTQKASLVDERAFHKALEPLARLGRLSAVLVQWPWSLRESADNRKVLMEVLSRFSAYPLAVEFRHRTWGRKDLLAMLRERGIAFCNIDQPALTQCMSSQNAITSDLVYFRFHGRNAASWFREGTGRDERYNYLYSRDELKPWVQAVRESASPSREVVVILNNHYKGQAVTNAFQIQYDLTGEKQEVPETLLMEYPELEAVSDTIYQRRLFG